MRSDASASVLPFFVYRRVCFGYVTKSSAARGRCSNALAYAGAYFEAKTRLLKEGSSGGSTSTSTCNARTFAELKQAAELLAMYKSMGGMDTEY